MNLLKTRTQREQARLCGEEPPFLGRKLSLPKRYSEEMAWLMDQEIKKILIDAGKATEILTGKRHTLDALTEASMKEEMLERADVERIIQGSKGQAQTCML